MVNWLSDYVNIVSGDDEEERTISESGSNVDSDDPEVLQAANTLVNMSSEWRQTEINKRMALRSLTDGNVTEEHIRYALWCIQDTSNRRSDGVEIHARVVYPDHAFCIEKAVRLLHNTVAPGKDGIEKTFRDIARLMAQSPKEYSEAVKALRLLKDECYRLCGYDTWDISPRPLGKLSEA